MEKNNKISKFIIGRKDAVFLSLISFFVIAVFVYKISSSYPGYDALSSAYFPIYNLSEYKININTGTHYLDIFGMRIPYSEPSLYTYALDDMMMTAGMYLFGINIFGMKFPFMLMGLLSLWMTYIAVFYIFSRKSAVITTLLCSGSPVFYEFYLKSAAIHEPLINSLFFTSIVFFIFYIVNNRNNVFLYLSFFFLGLMLSIKITALWRILFVIILIFTALKSYFPLKKNILLFCLLLFFSGSSMFCYTIIKHNFTFVKKISLAFRSGEEEFAMWDSNKRLLSNIKLRLWQYYNAYILIEDSSIINKRLIKANSKDQDMMIWFNSDYEIKSDPSVFKRVYKTIPTLMSYLLILLILLSKTTYSYKKQIKWIVFYLLMFIVISCFALESYQHGHLFAVFLVNYIIIALAAVYVFEYMDANKIAAYSLMTAMFLPVFLVNADILHNYLRRSSEDNKYPAWQKSIFEVSDYIRKKDIKGLQLACSDEEGGYLQLFLYYAGSGNIDYKFCNINTIGKNDLCIELPCYFLVPDFNVRLPDILQTDIYDDKEYESKLIELLDMNSSTKRKIETVSFHDEKQRLIFTIIKVY